MSQNIGVYITSIECNNGTKIGINQNDIVVFVGPNNAGKSQSLQNLHQLVVPPNNRTLKRTQLITNITTTSTAGVTASSIVNLLEELGFKKEHDLGSYVTYDINDGDEQQQVGFLKNDQGKLSFRDPTDPYYMCGRVFVAYLDTKRRLSIVEPPASVATRDKKTHPIQSIATNPLLQGKVSDAFNEAFGVSLIVNAFNGISLPLCLETNKETKKTLQESGKSMSDHRVYLDSLPQLQEQGDGMKSFAGILLYLVQENRYKTFLIDEPEAFLHPPQANIMGTMLDDLLGQDRQAFIATHSQDFIRGLLEKCPQRVKIVRITREGDTNHFALLKNEEISKIWDDSILKYSNVMNSLFHNTTVLCESDTDCKFYSILLGHMKSKERAPFETLFIHSSGKDRMVNIIKALQPLGVNVLTVPDLDFLANEDQCKTLVKNLKADWKMFEKDYKIFSSNINSCTQKYYKDDVKAMANEAIDSIAKDGTPLSKSDFNKIKSKIKYETKWDEIKQAGAAAIPPADVTNAFNRLVENLKAINVFIVTCGEIENFVREVGNHGPGWLNDVLERFPDLDHKVYDQAKDFIKTWNIYPPLV